jgi:hypothetical protein
MGITLAVVVALETLMVPQESVNRVLTVRLFVLLELQSTTEAVTAVVAELFTTTHNVRFMLELLVMAFTHILVVRLLTLQLLSYGDVFQLTSLTQITAAMPLGTVLPTQLAVFVKEFATVGHTPTVRVATFTLQLPALVTTVPRHL